MVPAAFVFRGDALEAVHYASVAVVGATGELTHWLGDPEFATMTRSSIKPFQAMASVAAGVVDHYHLTSEHLAIMCGSHNGSDYHRSVVLSILEAAGNAPACLQCGSHWPMQSQLAGVYPKEGEDADPVRHNCSGKHAGFLALTRLLDADVAGYLEFDGPTQRRVKDTLAEWVEVKSSHLTAGIDGCSAPNYPLTLRQLAAGFGKLAVARNSSALGAAAARVRQAMMEHPLMVSGDNRFDFALASALARRGICKVGAEGIEAIGLTDPPLGIVVKVADGAWRALEPICLEVLRQLGVLQPDQAGALLSPYWEPKIVNARGLATGAVRVDFRLNRA